MLFPCLETLAFHAGILLSCFTILQTLTFFKNLKNFLLKQSSPSSSPEATATREFNLSLIPLTLFYSSLTKLFLLLLLTIWTPEAPAHGSLSITPVPIQSDWFNALLSDPVTAVPSIVSQFSRILDDDKLDREWVIRNLLGGMSAGFGLRGTYNFWKSIRVPIADILVKSDSRRSSLLFHTHNFLRMGSEDCNGPFGWRMGGRQYSNESSLACA
jgi:hypothetical protein